MPRWRSSSENSQTADQGEVNNSTAVAVGIFFNDAQNLFELFFVTPDGFNTQIEIRAVNALMVVRHFLRRQSQLSDDVFLYVRCCSRCQCYRGGISCDFPKLPQPGVIGAKVMSPFTDAVSFIDGQQPNVALRDHLDKFRFAEPFGSDIKQTVFSRCRGPVSRFPLTSAQG